MKSIYIIVSIMVMYEIGFHPKYLPHNVYSHFKSNSQNEAFEFYKKYRHLNNEYYILECVEISQHDKYQYRVIEISTSGRLDKLLCLA